MPNTIERGDLYFFYRPKVDVDDPRSVDDVQRFYLAMLPDKAEKGRLFVVGKKRLPDIRPAQSGGREWMLNSLVGKPEELGEEMRPLVYETKTRGERHQGEAIPAGEARYALFDYDGSSRLAYKLASPGKPGKVQDEFGIHKDAAYLISVRNPDLDVPGFPDAKPDYPKQLLQKFADERWLAVSDPALLDYENAQLVLIGSNESLEEMDVTISGKPDLFGKLGLERSEWPVESLTRGKFASPEHEAEAKEPDGDRSKGGRRGGRQAAQAPSAAGIAHALKGIDFPSDRAGLVDYAAAHEANVRIVEVLEQLPKRNFQSMADVEKALSEVR